MTRWVVLRRGCLTVPRRDWGTTRGPWSEQVSRHELLCFMSRYAFKVASAGSNTLFIHSKDELWEIPCGSTMTEGIPAGAISSMNTFSPTVFWSVWPTKPMWRLMTFWGIEGVHQNVGGCPTGNPLVHCPSSFNSSCFSHSIHFLRASSHGLSLFRCLLWTLRLCLFKRIQVVQRDRWMALPAWSCEKFSLDWLVWLSRETFCSNFHTNFPQDKRPGAYYVFDVKQAFGSSICIAML